VVVNTLTVVFPLVGVLIGVTLQYWFSRSGESKKHLQAMRIQAYVDYLKAVTEAASGSPGALAHASESKARIAVFGSPSVVTALAQFEKEGPVLDNPKSIARFLAIVEAMRSGTGQVPPDSLRVVLFGGDRK
jgi:hypothetical protein